MAYILKKFNVFKERPQLLKYNIKCLHIFENFNAKNVIFVTNDDKVYGFGHNACGRLGLGHNTPVDEPHIIPELCDQNIIQFFNGKNFQLALSGNNEVYVWGCKVWGDLGKGFVMFKTNFEGEGNEYLKPFKVAFDSHINVKQVMGGWDHCLVLSHDGQSLYGWGDNSCGQVGAGGSHSPYIPSPKLINIEDTIEYVHCFYKQSYAITSEGMVFSWGRNHVNQLGHKNDGKNQCVFTPKKIAINNVKSMCCTLDITYFLKDDGNVYCCGYDSESIELLISDPIEGSVKLNEFHYDMSKMIASNGDGIYEIIHKDSSMRFERQLRARGLLSSTYRDEKIKVNKTSYKSFIDYYAKTSGITQKTVHIESDIKFETTFNVVKEISEGGFGRVYVVCDKKTQFVYAIKKIIGKGEGSHLNESLREIEIISKLNNQYIVDYYHSWIENMNEMHILMELCEMDLTNFLDLKSNAFAMKAIPVESITFTMEERVNTARIKANNQKNIAFDYYISCEIFIELIHAIHYLHGLNPPVIHRDLKPQNILVTSGNEQGTFLKLCDFGISVTDNMLSMMNTCGPVGTVGFIAPELFQGKYDTKSDVYSLGIIAGIIFDSESEYPEFSDKFTKLANIIGNMSQDLPSDRPTADQLFTSINEWSLQQSDIDANDKFVIYPEELDSLDNTLLLKFTQTKLKQNRKDLNSYLGSAQAQLSNVLQQMPDFMNQQKEDLLTNFFKLMTANRQQ